jgi:hypothetical protein
MTRVSIGIALLVMVFPVFGVASGSAAAPTRTKQVSGTVQALAMDGPRLAYGVAPANPGGCNRVSVWNVATGSVVRVSGAQTCREESTSTGSGFAELAVAGNRVAWIFNLGGNSESVDHLYVSSTSRPRERRVANAFRSGDVDCELAGAWLGGLVGDGSLLDVNRWTTIARPQGDEQQCVDRINAGSLRRVTSTGTAMVASGTDTIVAADADAGRVAVLRGDSTVALYSQRGRQLRAVTVAPAREVALWKDRIVTLTKQRALQVYSTAGSLLRTVTIPSGGRHVDVHSGIAAFAVARTLYGVRLASGPDHRLAVAPSEIVGVTAEAPGVAYAYNRTVRSGNTFRNFGKVVFRPLSSVLRAL